MSTITVAEPLPAAPRSLDLVGARPRVPLAGGDEVEYANLDYAASTPCLAAVRDAVHAAIQTYGSVHRGAGHPSRLTTGRYEAARESVRRFVGAWRGDTVVFTRNTTDSMNLLARCLPAGTTVVVFETEHHASLLPWRRHGARTRVLEAPGHPAAGPQAAARALRDAPEGPRLLVIAGASNVTGEVWPIAEFAAVARRHGARIAVDAAQLVAHLPVDMTALDIDYLALSGHKLYAPFGAGALVGRTDWLAAAPPYLAGGGATRAVRRESGDLRVTWAPPPQRHEAGSPNVPGAIALGVACDTLAAADRHAIGRHERVLADRLREGLAAIPEVSILQLWPGHDRRIGVVAFTVARRDASEVAARLATEYGIGVRDGAFCAHPMVTRLTGTDGGAVRASLGLGSTVEHVDRLIAALRDLTRS